MSPSRYHYFVSCWLLALLVFAPSIVFAQTSPPNAPTGLAATAYNGGVSLSWNAVSGAASYNVYKGSTAGGESGLPVTVTSPGASISCPNNSTFYFKVYAVNSVGTSGSSNEATATPNVPLLPGPIGLKAIAGSTQVALYWNPVTNATSYNLYRYTTGDPTYQLYKLSLTSTSFTDTGLTGGQSYTYYVCPVDKDGQGNGSNLVYGVPGSAILPATNLAVTAQNGYTSLTWNVVPGASYYNIYRSTTAGGEGNAPIVTGVSYPYYNDSTVTNGTTYYYKVTPVSGNGEGLFSNEATATPNVALLPGPIGLKAIAGSTQVALYWNSVTNATSYNLYRYTTGNPTYQLYKLSLTSTSFTDTGLTGGQSYTYYVCPVDKDGQGNGSNLVYGVPGSAILPATNLAVTAQNGYTSLTWNAVVGAGSYNIYRSTTAGGEGNAPIVTGVSYPYYNDSTVTNGTTYYYKVTPVSGNGEGLFSNEATATPNVALLPGPIGLKAIAGSTQVALYWNSVTNATSYNLYRYTTGNPTYQLYKLSLTSTSFTDTGLTGGQSYTYYVCPVDKDGQGNSSNYVSAVPGSAILPATNLAVTAQNGYTSLTWNAVVGAGSYNIYRSTTAGGEGNAPIVTGVSYPYYNDSTVTNGTTYYYKVTPVSGNGEGLFSNEASATPNVPLLTAPTLHGMPGNAQMTLSWNAISGATSYNLYRLVNGTSIFQLYQVGLTGTTCIDSGLDMTTSYTYYVAAVSKDGQGSTSNQVSTADPVIDVSSTFPANPYTLYYDPGRRILPHLSVNIAGFYAPNQVVGVTIYDTTQHVIQTLPTQLVTLNGSGTNGTVPVQFTWDGTTNVSDGNGGYLKAPFGVYLFKFEVNPPLQTIPPSRSYDSDKSLNLSELSISSSLTLHNGATDTYQINYALTSRDTPTRSANIGEIDAFAYNFSNTGATVALTAADLTPGSHTKTINVPSSSIGPLTFILSAQDNDADSDKAGRQRYALQQGCVNQINLTVQPQAYTNILAWSYVPGLTASSFIVQRSASTTYPPAESSWQTISVPTPMWNDFYWYTFDPNTGAGTQYYYRIVLVTISPLKSNVASGTPIFPSDPGWPGWTALQTPYTSGSNSLDWHGFLIGTNKTDYSGNLTSTLQYSAAAGIYKGYLSTSDNLFAASAGNDGVTVPAYQSVATNLQGGSIVPRSDFYWLWTPPMLGNVPDLTDFPVPPLFAISQTSTFMHVTGSLSATASGTISDGNTLTATLPVAPTGNPWQFPTNGYMDSSAYITPTTTVFQKTPTDQSSRLQSIKFTPSATLNISSPAGIGLSKLDGQLFEFGFPIHMKYPGIFARPDLTTLVYQYCSVNSTAYPIAGNQFVYDAAAGNVQIPAEVDLLDIGNDSSVNTGVGQQASSSLLWVDNTRSSDSRNLIGWTFGRNGNPGMPNTLGFTLDPGDYTCYSSSAMYTGIVQPVNTITMYGQNTPILTCPNMPPDNGDFGNYKVTLQVKPPGGSFQPSEVSYIQTLFNDSATNHPNPDPIATMDGPIWDYNPGSAPNWYHYYTQVYPGYPVPGQPSETPPPDFSYSGGAPSSTDGYKGANGLYNIHFGASLIENGVSGTITFPVFELDPNSPTGMISLAGKLTVRTGILQYLYIAAHERGHQLVFTTSGVANEDINTGRVQPTIYGYYNGNSQLAIYDNLSKYWKAAHHMNPNTNITVPNAYPGVDGITTPDKPDNEVLADILALKPVFDNKSIWKQDWSSKGMQYYSGSQGVVDSSKLPINFMAQNPSNSALDIYYQFTPVNGLATPVFSISDIQKLIDPQNKIKILQSLNDF